MRRARVQFPTIVGLVDDSSGASPSEQAVQAILEILGDLRDREPGGLSFVPQTNAPNLEGIVAAVRSAGIDCRMLNYNVPLKTGREQDVDSAAVKLELIDASDLFLVLRGSKTSEPTSEEIDILKYAKSIGRPVVEIDAETGTRRGDLPSGVIQDGGWLPAIFTAAGVSSQDDLSVIRSRVAAIARDAKPATRRWWIWLLLIQGLAVFLPLMWLTKRWTGLSWFHALVILLCVVAMVTIAWWLRWRGMQKIWARTRLVAEVGRSLLATRQCSHAPALHVLDIVPTLRPLRWCKLPAVEPIRDFAKWREHYIRERLGEQMKYFSADAQAMLESQRGTLNRWATLLLDVSLAFAAAGFVTVLYSFTPAFGGAGLEAILGAAGITSVLGVILVQTFATVEGLNRRIAICVRQREMITRAKIRLNCIRSAELVMRVVDETEREFLQENLDWYFTFEHTQHFCSMRRTQQTLEGIRPISRAWYYRWVNATLARFGVAIAFVLRVLIGRVPWAVVPAVFVALWLGLHLSSSARWESSKFVDQSSRDWRYDPEKAEHGCVIIVHGLWGETTDWVDATGRPFWTTQMARAIAQNAQKRGAAAPNIIILDWHVAARPSKLHGWFSQYDPTAALFDYGAIRPDAQRVGTEAAIRLIREKAFDRKQPLHLIGHSAGGFVVARCAMVLKDVDMVANPIHVTILDTPPGLNLSIVGSWHDEDLLRRLPEAFSGEVDFYKTSDLVQLPKNFSLPGLHFYEPPHKREGLTRDHAYAWQWYIHTIDNPGSGEGFDRSPLVNKK